MEHIADMENYILSRKRADYEDEVRLTTIFGGIMKLKLSKIIPVRFKTEYRVGKVLAKRRSTWWQWRGHIFFHRVVEA